MGTTSLTWPKRTMPANAAARRSCKFGPTVPGGFYINGELDIVVKFAVDSLLEGTGFEPSVPLTGTNCRFRADDWSDTRRDWPDGMGQQAVGRALTTPGVKLRPWRATRRACPPQSDNFDLTETALLDRRARIEHRFQSDEHRGGGHRQGRVDRHRHLRRDAGEIGDKLGVVDAQPQRQRIEAALVERFQIVDEAALRVLRKPSRLPR